MGGGRTVPEAQEFLGHIEQQLAYGNHISPNLNIVCIIIG